MKSERFRGPVLSGHKECAVEVPFDPAERWSSTSIPIRPGRRGHPVKGSVNKQPFESAIVARSRRFYLLLDDELMSEAEVSVGDVVSVVLQPVEASSSAAKKTTSKEPKVAPTQKGAKTSLSGADILERVREICLALPEATEKVAWSAPTFRVRNKQFAMFLDNHHGDGRIALWIKAAPGAQETLVAADPRYFFVPPYVGPSGWLGIELDRGLDWGVVAELVTDGYRLIAGKRLLGRLDGGSEKQ